MPAFEVRIASARGNQTLTVSAKNRDEAERIMKRRGRIVQIRRKGLFDMQPGLSSQERYIFLLKLSTMTGSRVPLGRALDLIATTFRGNIRRVAASLNEKIQQGMQLVAAMETESKSFPGSLVALVRAGLAAGNTATALREAAEFELMIQSIRKGSVKEIYAGIGYLIAAAGLTVATMEYFGPMVTENPMFRNQPGVDIELMEAFGYFVMWSNIALCILVLLFGFFGTAGRQLAPGIADKIIARIPYYSDMILAQKNYVVFYKLGLLIESGVRVEDSLRLAWEDCPRGALREDLRRALDFIQRGRPWAEAMETMDPTDRASLMASTDRLDIARTFRLLADQFRDLYLARVKAAAPAINMTAALYMTAGSIVLFGLTILPMLQLAASMN